jgi:hypothetical protein
MEQERRREALARPEIGHPRRGEAAPYYFRYIDRIPSGDIIDVLEAQLDETLPFLRGISEERSLYRYAPEKWSVRQLLGHINDAERLFAFRAFWFARGFDSALPSFDEKVSADASGADGVPWARHVDEFQSVRRATLTLFRGLPAEAWSRSGVASDNPFSVRALAYVTAGHLVHHLEVLRGRYQLGEET